MTPTEPSKEDLAERFDRAIPPASPPTDAARVAAAAADSDQIIIIAPTAGCLSPCLGEISPLRAEGVAVRIEYSDLTDCPPPPPAARLATLPTTVTIIREKLYPSPVRSYRVAWKWTYSYRINGAIAVEYGPGLDSLCRMLRRRHPGCSIIKAWEGGRA